MRTCYFYCYTWRLAQSGPSFRAVKDLLIYNSKKFKELESWCKKTLGKKGKNWEIKEVLTPTVSTKMLAVYGLESLCTVKYIRFKNKSSYILYKMTFLL